MIKLYCKDDNKFVVTTSIPTLKWDKQNYKFDVNMLNTYSELKDFIGPTKGIFYTIKIISEIFNLR